MHDFGISGERGYDKYRRRFCEKYSEDGFVYDPSDDTAYSKIGQDLERKKEQILEMAQEGIAPELVKRIEEFEMAGYIDTDIFCLEIYLKIVNREMEAYGSSLTQNTIGWNDFKNLERSVRMLLWRMELMNSVESAEGIVRGLEKGTLSLEFVQELVERFSGNKEHVWQELARHMHTL